jgi:hypothetical protein
MSKRELGRYNPVTSLGIPHFEASPILTLECSLRKFRENIKNAVSMLY